jgi:hypothetical protein
MQRFPILLFVLLSILVCTLAVDRSKFRTCQDTRFCRVFRNQPPTNAVRVYA